MTPDTPPNALWSGLPDPVLQAGFYRDVPLKRLVAWGIDTVITLLLTFAVVLATALIGLFFLPVLFLTLGFLYRWATLSRHSATWGMRLAAIEFRAASGARLDPATAFVHTLAYSVAMAMVLPQILSAALMAMGPRGQGLGDLVLGTAAINRPARL